MSYVLDYTGGVVTGATIDGSTRATRGDADAGWLAFLGANPGLDLSLFPTPTATEILTLQRARADALLADAGGTSKLQRAVVLLMLDEINVLRAWVASFAAAAAAATSLANLQARVAALAATPPRTKAQLISAVQAKIDAGDSD